MRAAAALGALALALLACLGAGLRLPSSALRRGRVSGPGLRRELGRSGAGTILAATEEEEVDTGFADLSEGALRQRRVAEAKAALLEATEPLSMGFKSTREQRKDVKALIEALASAGGDQLDVETLDGQWELVFSDAPDILGIRGGPLSKLEFIGQDIDAGAGTIDNVIRYSPSGLIRGTFGRVVAGLEDDRLEQRVLLRYEQDGRKVRMTVRGTSIAPENTLGGRLNLRPLKLEGPLKVPFGNFEILYNDGELRVIKTGRGNYGVNKRIG
mmetsp:Transcript_25179/g.78998  ORF Transcript_25179/g.78998 Transcript_25179/m.78998 type:complete len:271 (-) Transcript_25179:1705-2517(-)